MGRSYRPSDGDARPVVGWPVPEVDLVFPARLRRVRRPGRRRPGVPLRPDLADVALHLHLRPGLPGHLRRRARTPAAARSARTSPTRPTRSGSRRTSSSSAPDLWQFQPERPGPRSPTGSRPTTRASARPGRRARRAVGVHLPQPPGLRDRRRLRAALAGAAAGAQPAGDQAGRVLAAADPADLPHRRAARTTRRTPRCRSASTTGAAGDRAATTSTGTARATPRRTSAREPVYVTNEPELVELMGAAGVRRAGRRTASAHLRRARPRWRLAPGRPAVLTVAPLDATVSTSRDPTPRPDPRTSWRRMLRMRLDHLSLRRRPGRPRRHRPAHRGVARP